MSIFYELILRNLLYVIYVKIYKAIILSRSEDSGLFTFNLQKKSF